MQVADCGFNYVVKAVLQTIVKFTWCGSVKARALSPVGVVGQGLLTSIGSVVSVGIGASGVGRRRQREGSLHAWPPVRFPFRAFREGWYETYSRLYTRIEAAKQDICLLHFHLEKGGTKHIPDCIPA